MILSILIRTLPWRHETFNFIYNKLLSQRATLCLEKFVEILPDDRGKDVSSGQKANDLIRKAQGKYVVFIDDDDDVAEYYIDEMVKACRYDMDCVAINGHMTTDGRDKIRWRLSKNYENVTIIENGEQIYLRKTNHITAVKREHALKAPFPNVSNAEDKGYSEGVNRFLKSEFVIQKPMYHYKYSSQNKDYK